MLHIHHEEEFDAALVKYPKLVLDFSSSWCGPCKKIEPFLKGLAEEYEDQITFFKADVDKVPSLAAEFHVSSIPALKFFESGKEVKDLAVFGANIPAIKKSVDLLNAISAAPPRYPHES